jgi:hypothetical protein
MQVRDSTKELLDPEGVEFPTLEALRKGVLLGARDLMSGDVLRGLIDFSSRIDAEDESGAIIYTLPFSDALHIIDDHPLVSAAAA